MTNFENCCQRDDTAIIDDVAPFFKILLLTVNKTLAVHSSTTVGELAARSKTNSPKEQLWKPLQNFKFQVSLFAVRGTQKIIWWLDLLEIVIQSILLWDSNKAAPPPPLHNDYPH
jgi:hypothetical protein